MSQKTKHEASMSRLPGNRSAKFVPYLIPGLIGLFAVVVVPFIWNIYLSFTRWRGVGPVKWVGLKNWKRLFSDSTFWISFANSFWIIVAIVVIPTILGLFISSLLTDVIQKKFGGKTASFLRALFYLPQLLPVAVAAIIMGWIFRPEDGAVNALLAKIGLGALQHNWLGSPDSALPILMFILVWIQLGYPIVIFMSGLQRVDPELYEAAGLDGANWWQKFRVVTLPSIIPELLVVILTGNHRRTEDLRSGLPAHQGRSGHLHHGSVVLLLQPVLPGAAGGLRCRNLHSADCGNHRLLHRVHPRAEARREGTRLRENPKNNRKNILKIRKAKVPS